MTMELIPRTAPTVHGDHYFGSAERTISSPSQLKLQTTGPDEEVLLLEGPPTGKKWLLVLNVFVREVDAT